MVLPEVLRNPIAYFNFNQNDKKTTALFEQLSKLKYKPNLYVKKRRIKFYHKKTLYKYLAKFRKKNNLN
jgi:hypothetical protein